MSVVRKVTIDGVRYVPALDVSIDVQLLARALVYSCLGKTEMDDPYISNLQVLVSDNLDVGEGETIEEFVAGITNLIAELKDT